MKALRPSLRPVQRDDRTGALTITLNDEDLALAYRAGFARYTTQRQGGNHDAAFRRGQGARNDIEGVLGEIAFWLLCGYLPPQELVLALPEWKRLRGPDGGCLTDVFDTEVRATWHRDGMLPIHRDSSRDGEAKRDTPFVLAVLDWITYYPETGFSTGDPRIDALLGKDPDRNLMHYQQEVRFPGWFRGSEVKDEHYRTWWPKPDYGIEQRELHPMSELAPDRFILPQSEAEREADELIAALGLNKPHIKRPADAD